MFTNIKEEIQGKGYIDEKKMDKEVGEINNGTREAATV